MKGLRDGLARFEWVREKESKRERERETDMLLLLSDLEEQRQSFLGHRTEWRGWLGDCDQGIACCCLLLVCPGKQDFVYILYNK